MSSKIIKGPMNEKVKPFCWLLGKWTSTFAEVMYPNMKTMKYEEEVVFEHWGQPLVNYSSTTWNAATKAPMHVERGFIGITTEPDQVVLLTAQNFGLVTREVGVMKDETLIVSANCIVGAKWMKKPVKGMHRCFRLNDCGLLEMCMFLETPNIPPTLHLQAKYKKADED